MFTFSVGTKLINHTQSKTSFWKVNSVLFYMTQNNNDIEYSLILKSIQKYRFY